MEGITEVTCMVASVQGVHCRSPHDMIGMLACCIFSARLKDSRVPGRVAQNLEHGVASFVQVFWDLHTAVANLLLLPSPKANAKSTYN